MKTKNNRTFLTALLAFALVAGMSVPQQAVAGEHDSETCHQQDPEGRRPRLNPEEIQKRLRIYITREVNLSEAEADVIFPLFFEMKSRQRELHRKSEKAMRRIRKEKLTERDCGRLLAEVQQMKAESVKAESKCINQLLGKGIPASKVILVMNADQRFGREMFHGMTRAKNGNHPKKEGRKRK